jgi:phosphoribosyl 1,2-cyclic phosphate phosphodiesterase
LKITFLGTGTSQGIPVIACNCDVCKSSDSKDKRLRSSVLIEDEIINLVIDTGPDFRQQMLNAQVHHLEGVLLTHGHKDHIAGLDDVRAFNYVQRKAIDVYARNDVHETLKTEFSYAFAVEKYPGVPEIHLHEIKNKLFKIKDLEILPISVMHYKLPIFGYRIKNFTYITDANYIDDIEKEKIKGSEILVVNALRKQKHISHFTLSEALKLIEEIKPKTAYLTHISHIMGLHEAVSKELPENVYFAYDGLQLEL